MDTQIRLTPFNPHHPPGVGRRYESLALTFTMAWCCGNPNPTLAVIQKGELTIECAAISR
jgi:hypothetical protein